MIKSHSLPVFIPIHWSKYCKYSEDVAILFLSGYHLNFAWEAEFKVKTSKMGGFIVAPWWPQSPLSLLFGLLSFYSILSPSLSLSSYRITCVLPLPSLPSLPACLDDTWSGLSLILGQLSLPTWALPDNTVQADTNIIKNEKQLVRDPASVNMKWKVEERRDGCLTVQKEKLKNSQRGPVQGAEWPLARSLT